MPYRILVSVLAAVALFLAFRGLNEEPDRLAAERAELGVVENSLSPAASLATEAVLQRHYADCRADFRRAATALSSTVLQREAEIESGLPRAEDNVRAQLRCSPSNGNAWLLLAMISHLAKKPQLEVKYSMLSQSNAPREGWIVVRRIDFICSTAKSSFDQLANVLQRDFEALLRDRLFEKVSDHYSRCRDQIGNVLENALAHVDPTIRSAFVQDVALRQARGTQ